MSTNIRSRRKVAALFKAKVAEPQADDPAAAASPATALTEPQAAEQD